MKRPNKLDEIWNDEERINALYNHFRNRELNPLHYDNKLKFWKDTIVQFSQDNSHLTLKLKDLEDVFVYKDAMKPKCLDIVLKSMIKDGSLMSKGDYLKQGSGWTSYLIDKLVWTPFGWTKSYLLSQTTQTTSTQLSTSASTHQITENDYETNYVVPSLIEKKALAVYELMKNTVEYPELDCVIEYSKFEKLCLDNNALKNHDEIELVVKYLLMQNIILIDSNLIKEKQLVKFTFTKTVKVKPITELEQNNYLLKLSEQTLNKQIDSLNEQCDNLTKEIKLHLKQKSKQNALKSLKKRKQIEKQIDSKNQILMNISDLLLNLQHIDTNKKTIDVYKNSLNVLKEFNKSDAVQNIDDLIDELKENFQIKSEIDDLLSNTKFGDDSISNVDLENELNDLLNNKSAVTPSPAINTQINKPVSEDNLVKDFKKLAIDDLLDQLPELPTANISKQSVNE